MGIVPSGSFQTAVAANGGSLAQRIARLLGQSRPPARTALGPGVLAVAMLLVVAAFGVFGQQAARPEFQVASIKPNTAVGAARHGRSRRYLAAV